MQENKKLIELFGKSNPFDSLGGHPKKFYSDPYTAVLQFTVEEFYASYFYHKQRVKLFSLIFKIITFFFSLIALFVTICVGLNIIDVYRFSIGLEILVSLIIAVWFLKWTFEAYSLDGLYEYVYHKLEKIIK